MKKFLLMTSVVCTVVSSVWAQSTIKGTVSSEGENLPGVSVLVEGSAAGTVTDIDGNYSVEVPSGSNTLIFTFIGMATERVEIGGRSVVDVSMKADVQQLSEVVVTALGVERDQASLGYAIQEVDGAAVTTAKEDNFIRSLSGKVAGINVKASSTMGGGTNILIRGNTSLTGSNQPLFVVDGVPINNSSYNSSGQLSGGGGYDFGNSAADINPEDIESISVLKGGSASALYGSRASNGVVMITTKKAKAGVTKVNISSGVTFSKIDESTFHSYQNEYGGGYSDTFPTFTYDASSHPDYLAGSDGDPYVQTYADESWGPRFDGSMVRHWDSWDPTDTENFGQLRAWEASPNSIEHLFKTGVALNNNISVEAGTAKNSMRASFTDYRVDGTLPNSELNRRTFNVTAVSQITEKLKSTLSANLVRSEAVGRAGTGYSDNDGVSIMASFGNWHQRQLDLSRMEKWKNDDGIQRAWNRNGPTDPNPAYWDNPYWTRNENIQNDERDRIYGKYELTYKALDWLSITGRAGIDQTKYTREWKIAKGGVVEYVGRGAFPGYWVGRDFEKQQNYDLFASFEKYFDDSKFSLGGMLGANWRQQNWERAYLGTSDGLVMPNVYSINNSVNDIIGYDDYIQQRKDHAYFGSVNVGYADMVFLEATYRNEHSSTLNDPFGYYSLSGSFVFSELPALSSFSALSFGKLRASYAKTGNAAGMFRTNTAFQYVAGEKQNGLPTYYMQQHINNPNLKPEQTLDFEVGADLKFFENRLAIDFAWYSRVSSDQLLSTPIAGSSGSRWYYTNTGEIENKGIELAINATPVKVGKFSWDVNVNFSKYTNKVTDLPESLENIEIGSLYELKLQHIKGEDYGSFVGRDYVYNDAGERVIDEDGTYALSDPKVLGSVVPDWEMGIGTTVNYAGFSASVLFDIRKGGEIYSQAHRWLKTTGNHAETVGTNDLGNPIRNDYHDMIDDGNGNQIANPAQGGIILDGVTADGSPNDTRIDAYTYSNDGENPESASIFDGGYVKLRELSLGYTLPRALLTKTPFNNVSISVVGRNLAILSKSFDADPEISYGVGNVQGLDWGMLPRERTFGFKVNLGIGK
ncbi:SusC/RagA family TonB-linked outer membrane protein [Reichenbachiella sp.]|uniref:SusC/RagA family TonB-linked outer membrane protein n=1 Tax=Reichenbachiella sp. TaxID=2184521 RepID=UPI003B597AED